MRLHGQGFVSLGKDTEIAELEGFIKAIENEAMDPPEGGPVMMDVSEIYDIRGTYKTISKKLKALLKKKLGEKSKRKKPEKKSKRKNPYTGKEV